MKAAELQSLANKLKRKVKARERLTNDEMTIAALLVHIGLMSKLLVNNTKECMGKLNQISKEIENAT